MHLDISKPIFLDGNELQIETLSLNTYSLRRKDGENMIIKPKESLENYTDTYSSVTIYPLKSNLGWGSEFDATVIYNMEPEVKAPLPDVEPFDGLGIF